MSVELGTVIYASVKPIFKIYFIIGMGFFFAKRNILSVSTCRDISDVIVRAILPTLVFKNVVGNLQSSDIKNLGIIMVTSVFLFSFGGFIAYIIFLVTRSPRRWLGGLLSVGIFPNISDLPIAYVQTFASGGSIMTTEEGDKGVAYICIFLFAQALAQFTLGLYELVAWDFNDEIKDEENTNIETPSNTSTNSEKERNEHKEVHLQVPDNQESVSIDEEMSIATSLTSTDSRELPLPSNLGVTSQITNESDMHSGTGRRNSLGYRRRRNSAVSNNSGSLLQPTRSRDLRILKSQDMNDVIHEYSEYDSLRNENVRRIITMGSDTGGANMAEIKEVPSRSDSKKANIKAKLRRRGIAIVKNLCSVMTIILASSITIAMVPPLKALFVDSKFDMPNAPDGQPPLSFIMDIASYVGAASVPLGLLLLGATIARLEIGAMPPGFWKTLIGVNIMRLILLPIIGVLLVAGFNRAGWYGDDKLIRFISMLEFGLPSATSLVYFTAFYTDPNSPEHLQMDCLAACLILQYLCVFITLPFLVSFTIKVILKY